MVLYVKTLQNPHFPNLNSPLRGAFLSGHDWLYVNNKHPVGI